MKFCDQPWTTFTITANGDITPCFCGAWHNVGAIGNFLEQNFNDILISQKIKFFKKSIIDQTFSKCNTVCPVLHKLSVVDKTLYNTDDIILPKNLLLAIDRNCNLACESCRPENIFSKQTNTKADRILEKILDLYSNKEKEIVLHCDGSGDIFASASYKKFFNDDRLTKNLKLQLITNGNLITKNLELIEKLKNQIISVEVSIDAAIAETYKLTRGGVFDKVIDGIKLLVKNNIKTTLSFVVQKKNYREIKQAWQLGVDLGCDSIYFQKLVRWKHMSNSWWEENKLENNALVDIKWLKEELNILKSIPNYVIWNKSIPAHMTGDLYTL
jgi:radical SAM protein with 4Fe4S-binding SPASM domain